MSQAVAERRVETISYLENSSASKPLVSGPEETLGRSDLVAMGVFGFVWISLWVASLGWGLITLVS